MVSFDKLRLAKTTCWKDGDNLAMTDAASVKEFFPMFFEGTKMVH